MTKVDGKVCVKCGEWRKADEFVKNKRMRNGLHSYCLSCKRAMYQEKKAREHALKVETLRNRLIADIDYLIELVMDNAQ